MEKDLIAQKGIAEGKAAFVIENRLQTYSKNEKESYRIVHLAKSLISNLDSLKKVLDTDGVREKFADKESEHGNLALNTLDIMRNYINEEDMTKILAYLY